MEEMLQLSRRELDALKREILASLHCALPGIVESFDPETQTACIRPALHSRRASAEDSAPPASASRQAAEENAVPYPLLRDVPVFFPGSRTSALTYPVSPGDECLVLFADACIDGWFGTGGDPLPPSARRHDLSDAFAFVGFRSRPNALRNFPSAPSFFGRDR